MGRLTYFRELDIAGADTHTWLALFNATGVRKVCTKLGSLRNVSTGVWSATEYASTRELAEHWLARLMKI